MLEDIVMLETHKTVSRCQDVNILVRRSRRSGVARATIPDLGSHHLLLI